MTEPDKRTAQEPWIEKLAGILVEKQDQVRIVTHGEFERMIAEAYHAHAQQGADAEKAPPAQKWISVEEQLPDDGVDVLGHYEDGCCEVVMYNTELTEFKRLEGEWPGCEPTHWMPLPDPPAAEAQTAILQRVFFGRPGQDIPARRNETVYLREDGQSIVIHHDEALLPLLGSELLNKIKAWAMGAEAQTKEAD